MKIRGLVVAGIAILCAAPGLYAQKVAPAAEAAPSKVAVINLQAAIGNTAEGKQSIAELRAQFAPRGTELQNLQKQVQGIQQRLQAGATTLSDDEKALLTRQMNELQRRGQRETQDLTDDENEAQSDMYNRIGQKIVAVIEKYAQAHGIGMVLDDSSQTTSVLYATNDLDITQQIVKLYDETYPVKPATPAPSHPGASKRPGR